MHEAAANAHAFWTVLVPDIEPAAKWGSRDERCEWRWFQPGRNLKERLRRRVACKRRSAE
jgi:hypothetical protein